ncbi:MAG: hypothetical protein PHE94_05860, partial [Eubacteriales bacterium]|nr:hypothetical protein [Eubacteriales bacterium]
ASINAHKRLVSETKNGYVFLDESNRAENSTNLNVKVDLQPLLVSDKIKITITLMDYSPNSIETISIEDKYHSIIKKVIKKDSLQLVDYWSIDFDYDREIFQPKVFFCKENNKINQSCDWLTNELGMIGIRCIDIFGNSTFQEIDLREEKD